MSSSEFTRRNFMASGLAASALPLATCLSQTAAVDAAPETRGSGNRSPRAAEAQQVREVAAARQRRFPTPHSLPNGDETLYPTKIGSFGKCLPHNRLGEVEPAAFAALVKAMKTARPADFEIIPLGGPTKLKNPQAGIAFDLQGPDSHALSLATPPSLASAEIAAEMIELYWQALTRDVPYSEYDTNALIAAAAEELSALKDFAGPKVDGRVVPTTIFRNDAAGDLTGPYISQFLLRDVPFGAMTVRQQIRTCVPDLDFMTSYDIWLACQNGAAQVSNTFDRQARYIRNARDLGEYVHRDYSYQPYMNAALILLGLKAPFDANNPYNNSATQSGDGTFGAPAILDLVARVTINATKTSWYHKWSVHRRLRPEEYGGRVHNHKTGATSYPLHAQVLKSRALARVFAEYGSYLLPMAYPEGCPTHPAYPAAHAVLAGAATTVLKAFFDESYVLPAPVVASVDGLSLLPYEGAPLTVGNELTKLAGNIGMGRDAAGVHWRSDSTEGIELGEVLALNYLAETRSLWNERFDGFSVTRLDGTIVTI